MPMFNDCKNMHTHFHLPIGDCKKYLKRNNEHRCNNVSRISLYREAINNVKSVWYFQHAVPHEVLCILSRVMMF
jgi:hypothetical protein